jgi:hypothetical protein
MKKLVIGAAAMGGAALIAFGTSGTFAAFNDTASLANETGAGTLVLDASSSPTATAPAQAMNLKPGEKATYAYFVANGGTLAGTATASTSVTDWEHGCSSASERTDDPGCGNATDPGDFSRLATFQAYYVATDKAGCTTDSLTSKQNWALAPANTTLAAIANQGIGDIPVAAGEGACVVVQVSLGDVNNAVQGDSASLAVSFTLTQV